jgi:hypothetical protein
MFTPKVRLIICSICMILALLAFYQGKTYASILAVLFMIATIAGYFKHGTVYLAFRYLKSGELEKAKEALSLTTRLKSLFAFQRAYYYFVDGFLKMADKKRSEAFSAFDLALKTGLRLKNDQAVALCNMAFIQFEQGQRSAAKELVIQAEKLKVKPHVSLEIARIKQLIK